MTCKWGGLADSSQTNGGITKEQSENLSLEVRVKGKDRYSKHDRFTRLFDVNLKWFA